MKILITGAFGNVGKTVLKEACRRAHEVIVFEVENKKTRKEAKKVKNKIEKVVFGDIRNFDDVKAAVQECDAVIHLAAIIPPLSKKRRELTMDVNFGGTVNLIKAIKETKRAVPFIFTSSASVMGPTQLQNRLVSRNDPLVITGNYEESKIKCEQFLKENADNYLVFRLAGVLPKFSVTSLAGSFSLLEELFDMHPDMRLEMVTAEDVAAALVTGAEKLKEGSTPKNQAYILGGGKQNGWQFRGGEFLSCLFGALSLPVPDKKYFTADLNTYHLDWYDTKEAQQEFSYQNSSFEEYIKNVKKTFRVFKLSILVFRGYIVKRLVKMSPYGR
ncbi:MAG: NAD-dependent epimerase/dehydratase family protein [Candidatus Bathyarchaeia archaeon]|jgi:nucleoside-diphosphate-sugar epimerase